MLTQNKLSSKQTAGIHYSLPISLLTIKEDTLIHTLIQYVGFRYTSRSLPET